MKVKTSIMLSEQLVATIDQLCSPTQTRSSFIEKALWTYIQESRRDEQAAKDIEIINRRADYLNQETADAMTYQVPL